MQLPNTAPVEQLKRWSTTFIERLTIKVTCKPHSAETYACGRVHTATGDHDWHRNAIWHSLVTLPKLETTQSCDLIINKSNGNDNTASCKRHEQCKAGQHYAPPDAARRCISNSRRSLSVLLVQTILRGESMGSECCGFLVVARKTARQAWAQNNKAKHISERKQSYNVSACSERARHTWRQDALNSPTYACSSVLWFASGN